MLSYMLHQYAKLPVPEVTLRTWLELWLSEQEARCTDKGFSAHFPWRETGLCQEYFLQRKLSVDGKQFLTGPRYQGGDINKPFIDIVGMDSDVNHAALKFISNEWSQLRPQYIRILVPGQHFQQGIADQYIYASYLSDDIEFHDKSLTVQPAIYEDFDWCRQTLSEAYKHTWLTVPGLTTSNLTAAGDEELRDHISEREVYIVYEQGIRGGLLICQKGEIAFLRGYRITEKVILPAFRGRSLSARAQHILFRLLSHSCPDLSLYMGTIIPENIPSIKSAERAGRTCILSYQFLPVCGVND
ncbi:hypothetical protein ACQFN5_29720 (plasmid) [Klebsiella sp. WOUb02]|uniref:hypothetical protein n=1 Tax=Klebsiella sp. WOUb02 TaxID=3161071 RepID=UPI003CFA31AD